MCKEIREKFQELYSLNVNQYVEKKNDLSYLSWSYAWAEFKKIYPDATYEIKKDEQGRCYFGDDNIGYMVYTSVTAGGLTYEMWLPVMDGANKAMKPTAYTYKVADWQYDPVQHKRVRAGDIEKTVDAMTMFDVNKTVMRCLVKNLAMFGLGLYIYAGEDLPQDIKEYTCADCGKAVDTAMAQRTHKAFGVHLCKECGIKRSEAKKDEQ
jgi:DNA-directed RNA polymerase subunit RPC12/RpoP